MSRYAALAICLALATAGAVAAAARNDATDIQQPGGATTVFADGRNAFSLPLANLDDAGRTRFAIGNSFFRRNWVIAPSSTKARDGLGPHFIARSCGGCHLNDGRGVPYAVGDQADAAGELRASNLLIRLSVPGTDAHGGPRAEPHYGDQFTTEAIPGVKAEGKVLVRYRESGGQYGDGEAYSLREPTYELTELGYGALASDVMTSPRLPPQLIGMGLIEAIPVAEIEANQKHQAQRTDAIHGMANRVWDVVAGRAVIGRFGWKANVGTIAHQTAAAFAGDIGITSKLFPEQVCTAVQTDCLAAPPGGNPEIDERTFGDVVFYQQTLAPPARREPTHPEVRRGERLFAQADCAVCHRPSYRTGAQVEASTALANQRIYPYTDLLLHDMGDGLADGRPDFLANGRQWRTPPLWGIGLIAAVAGEVFLLHDGRARNVAEAILWHGGEATAARERFLAMNARDRRALIRFVESL